MNAILPTLEKISSLTQEQHQAIVDIRKENMSSDKCYLNTDYMTGREKIIAQPDFQDNLNAVYRSIKVTHSDVISCIRWAHLAMIYRSELTTDEYEALSKIWNISILT